MAGLTSDEMIRIMVEAGTGQASSFNTPEAQAFRADMDEHVKFCRANHVPFDIPHEWGYGPEYDEPQEQTNGGNNADQGNA
jgi:hypothetical protein